MRDVWIRPSTALRRRLTLAAATADMRTARLVQRLLMRWLATEKPVLGDERDVSTEGTPWKVHFNLPDDAHRRLRIRAAEEGVSFPDLVLRVLVQQCPHTTELLAHEMDREDTASAPPSEGESSHG